MIDNQSLLRIPVDFNAAASRPPLSHLYAYLLASNLLVAKSRISNHMSYIAYGNKRSAARLASWDLRTDPGSDAFARQPEYRAHVPVGSGQSQELLPLAPG